MKEPTPCEPTDDGVVVLARSKHVVHTLVRNVDRRWNLITETAGGISWDNLWREYEDVEILKRKPVPGVTEYQYAQRQGEDKTRTFCCRTASYDKTLARDHEAWRVATVYPDASVHLGPWLTFPWAVAPATIAA